MDFLLVSLVPTDLGCRKSAWFRCPLPAGTLKSSGSTEKEESGRFLPVSPCTRFRRNLILELPSLPRTSKCIGWNKILVWGSP